MLLLCCCTALRALHLWPLQFKTEVKCNVTCYGVQAARTTLNSCKEWWCHSYYIARYDFSIGSRRRYKKTAGRGVISHLPKYIVSLFILVPSSYVKLFNSSIIWRMYCRQCRCNNNGQTAQDSIAVATSTVVINGTTMWQL